LEDGGERQLVVAEDVLGDVHSRLLLSDPSFHASVNR
jgi:hypothetical protein